MGASRIIISGGRRWGSPILNIHTYIEIMKDIIKTIGITEQTKFKIKKLGKKYGGEIGVGPS